MNYNDFISILPSETKDIFNKSLDIFNQIKSISISTDTYDTYPLFKENKRHLSIEEKVNLSLLLAIMTTDNDTKYLLDSLSIYKEDLLSYYDLKLTGEIITAEKKEFLFDSFFINRIKDMMKIEYVFSPDTLITETIFCSITNNDAMNYLFMENKITTTNNTRELFYDLVKTIEYIKLYMISKNNDNINYVACKYRDLLGLLNAKYLDDSYIEEFDIEEDDIVNNCIIITNNENTSNDIVKILKNVKQNIFYKPIILDSRLLHSDNEDSSIYNNLLNKLKLSLRYGETTLYIGNLLHHLDNDNPSDFHFRLVKAMAESDFKTLSYVNPKDISTLYVNGFFLGNYKSIGQFKSFSINYFSAEDKFNNTSLKKIPFFNQYKEQISNELCIDLIDFIINYDKNSDDKNEFDFTSSLVNIIMVLFNPNYSSSDLNEDIENYLQNVKKRKINNKDYKIYQTSFESNLGKKDHKNRVIYLKK